MGMATGGPIPLHLDTPQTPQSQDWHVGEGASNGVREKPGFACITESSACSNFPPGIVFIISIQGVFRGVLGVFGYVTG